MRRVSVLFLVAALALVAQPAVAQKKNPKHLAGKVFFSAERIPDTGRSEMLKRFKKAKPEITLTRGKNKTWKATIVAFLSRAPYGGPITVWWYDQADKASFKAQEAAHVESVNQSKVRTLFVHDIEMDPNIGFNKKHAYWIYVGQIVGKRHKYLAKGLVKLER